MSVGDCASVGVLCYNPQDYQYLSECKIISTYIKILLSIKNLKKWIDLVIPEQEAAISILHTSDDITQ